MAEESKSKQRDVASSSGSSSSSSESNPTGAGSGEKQEPTPVTAREQLDALQNPGGGNAVEELEKRAVEQEKTQQEELSRSLSGPGQAEATALQEKAEEVPAAARAGVEARTPTQGGFMDQMSRRSANDALEGHFVYIDLEADGVEDAYKSVGLEDHTGRFGVYLEPMTRDPETGIPVNCLVQLRDDTHAKFAVPYEALSPAAPGGR